MKKLLIHDCDMIYVNLHTYILTYLYYDICELTDKTCISFKSGSIVALCVKPAAGTEKIEANKNIIQ